MQGLPFAYAWQDLKDLFKPIGGVVQADIVMGQDGRSRGWGTVNFETLADAEKAIKVMSILTFCVQTSSQFSGFGLRPML